jgi:hypothetical protein
MERIRNPAAPPEADVLLMRIEFIVRDVMSVVSVLLMEVVVLSVAVPV